MSSLLDWRRPMWFPAKLPGSALVVAACSAAPPAPTIGVTTGSAVPVEPSARAPGRTTSRASRASSLVVFALERDGVLPIGCFDAYQKRVQSGADCLDMLPDGVTVATDNGQTLVLGRRQDVSCPRGYSRQPGLALGEGTAAPAGAHFALWPKEAASRLSVDPGDLKPTDGEKSELETMVRQTLAQESTDSLAGPQRPFLIYTGEAVDLDGDGVPDHVFSAVIDSLEGFRFTGLVGFLSSQGGTASIIHRDPAYAYYLRGSVDLDGIGTRELLVTRALVERSTGAPTLSEDAVGIRRGRDYRFLGVPCPLSAEGG